MFKAASLLLVSLLVGLPVSAGERPPRRGEVDDAVVRALQFLSRQQDAEGSWSAQGGPNAAVTGLAVMAFLSAGQLPGEGAYGEQIEKGVRWVLKQQHQNGLIAAGAGQEMYHHGICTLMLCEVAGMTDGTLAADVRRALPKAIDVILKAQRGSQSGPSRGGWRYSAHPVGDSDMSCTGWQLLTLRAARDLGCDVPPASIDEAIAYIKRSQDTRTGAFQYQPHGGSTVACTGTAVLALELCNPERGHVAEALKAGTYILAHPPRWQGGEGYFFYSIYYCSQATFQLGDNYWNHFRPQLHQALLPNQKKEGGWYGPADGQSFGPSYGTAMAVLALTVEFRYLPIYQREEPGKEKKP